MAEALSAADKTLRVLAALGDHARLADLAAACRLPKPTVHRILQTLVRHGFARTDGHGNYGGGPRILSLAGRFLQRLDLAERVRPVLRDLRERTGRSVHLALRAGDEAVHVARVEGAEPRPLAARVGTRHELCGTAVGAAILAAVPDEEVRAVLARSARPGAEPAASLAGLGAVRERGYAVADGEPGGPVVAAAVFDHTGQVLGALCAAGPVDLADGADLPALVAAAAREVSRELGAGGGP